MNLNKSTPLYTISTAASLVNISVHTLRMYERAGLIIPFKKDSNQRLYSNEDIDRLQCIRRAIKEDKMSIEGIKRMLSLIPCWSIVPCTKKDRDNCDAFNGNHQPCWMLKHKNNYCAKKDCRLCEVYREFAQCDKIKEKIKELLT